MSYFPQINNPMNANGPIQQTASLFDHFIEGVLYDGNKFSTTAARGTWLCTQDATSVGPQILSTGNNLGELTLATDGDSGDHNQIQHNGYNWQMNAGVGKLIFETKIKISATTAKVLVGLGVSATDAFTTLPTGGVFFTIYKNSAGVADFYTRASSTSTTTTGVKTFVADTYAVLRFEYDGKSAVNAYVDGSLVATHTTNLPTATSLSPIICVEDAGTLTVDYVAVFPFVK